LGSPPAAAPIAREERDDAAGPAVLIVVEVRPAPVADKELPTTSREWMSTSSLLWSEIHEQLNAARTAWTAAQIA
jgi:hypothetical protein